MKRLLCAAGTLFALVAFSVVSHADPVRAIVRVPFRMARLAVGNEEFAVAAGVIDSFVINHAGSRTDTTEGFTLPGYTRPIQNGVASVDSLELFSIDLHQVGGGSVTAASGTTTFALQADFGGGNWVACVPFTTVTMTANGAGNYARTLTPDATASGSWAFYQAFLAHARFRVILVKAGSGTMSFEVSYWAKGN